MRGASGLRFSKHGRRPIVSGLSIVMVCGLEAVPNDAIVPLFLVD